MATLYVNDDLLLDYAAEHGSMEDAKQAMQEVLAEHNPTDTDDDSQ